METWTAKGKKKQPRGFHRDTGKVYKLTISELFSHFRITCHCHSVHYLIHQDVPALQAWIRVEDRAAPCYYLEQEFHDLLIVHNS